MLKQMFRFRNLVLIETLWNVKDDTDVTMPVEMFRINRNIVECKD